MLYFMVSLLSECEFIPDSLAYFLCVCVCVHVCVCVCVCVCVHAHAHMCMHVCACGCVFGLSFRNHVYIILYATNMTVFET